MKYQLHKVHVGENYLEDGSFSVVFELLADSATEEEIAVINAFHVDADPEVFGRISYDQAESPRMKEIYMRQGVSFHRNCSIGEIVGGLRAIIKILQSPESPAWRRGPNTFLRGHEVFNATPHI